MSVQETMLIARQWIEEVWNRGNVSLIDEMHTADYVYHDLRGIPPGDMDNESTKDAITDLRRAFPELHITVDDLVVAGNKIVLRWTASGIQRDIFFGYLPTNIRVIWHGITLSRLEKSRFQESWGLTDLRDQLSRLSRM